MPWSRSKCQIFLIDMMDSIHTIAVTTSGIKRSFKRKQQILHQRQTRLQNIGVTEISVRPINLWEVLSSIATIRPEYIQSDFFGTCHDHIICNIRAEDNSSKARPLANCRYQASLKQKSEQASILYLAIQTNLGIYTSKLYYSSEKVPTVYRDALKQNMANFMFILLTILETCPENRCCSLHFGTKLRLFQIFLHLMPRKSQPKQISEHYTDRNQYETDRYKRIAIGYVYDYSAKDNRHNKHGKTTSSEMAIKSIVSIESGSPFASCKQLVIKLMETIQKEQSAHYNWRRG